MLWRGKKGRHLQLPYPICIVWLYIGLYVLYAYCGREQFNSPTESPPQNVEYPHKYSTESWMVEESYRPGYS